MSKTSTNEKFRDRKFALLLYADNESHMLSLARIKESYDYAFALHDKDKDENGDLKKAHYHVIIRIGNNAIWNTALAKDLGLELRFVRLVKNMDRALEYLIHYNDAEKFQYEIDVVKGTLKDKLITLINASGKNEGERVTELIGYILKLDKKITITEFALYCSVNGYWDVYRRSSSIFYQVIQEHNVEIDRNSYTEQNIRDFEYGNEFFDIDGFTKNCSSLTGEIKKTPFD